MRLLLTIAAGLGLAAASRPPSTPPAAPSGKWFVEFADQHCMASHSFTSGTEQFAVGLQPLPTTENILIWLRVPKAWPRLERAQLAVGGKPIETTGMAPERIEPGGVRSYAVKLTRPELVRLLESGTVRVKAGAWSSEFAIPHLRGMQRTLDRCVTDLISKWGMSAKAQAELEAFPKPEKEPIYYVSAADYPTSALARNASGAAEVRITVGADGKGKSCNLVTSSSHADLDATTCAIFVKRARYQPARTKQGTAVEAPYVVKIRWSIP